MTTRYSNYNHSGCNHSDCNHSDCDDRNSYESNRQRHVHEYTGSTKYASEDHEVHNHNFSGVTGEAIYCNNSHVHKLETNTDFFDHYHKICDVTGPAIWVGCGKHVHLVTGTTSCNDGHDHDYIFATLIDAPNVDNYTK